MSKWRSTTVGDVITLQRGFDITKTHQRPGNVPVVSSGGIGSYHDAAMANGPGVVIGRKGTLGKIFYLDGAYWPHDTTLWVKDFKGNSHRFVYYFLKTLNFLSMDVGSSNPTLNRNHVHRVHIVWPSLGEQRAIAAVLGVLDDKIAVNERVAATALELSQALYINESFSTAWRSITLKEAARWSSGGTPKTSVPEYWGGDIPWISAASLKSPWIYDSDRAVTSLGSKNGTRIVSQDTIIFIVRGMSLTTEFRIGLTQREVAFGQDCKALVAAPGIDPVTLFLAIRSRSRDILEMVDLAGHGTGRLVTDRLAALSVQLPVEGAAEASFSAKVRPLIERASLASLENRALATLRDTLLPQLMSGRLRVKEAEKIVEEET